MTIPTVSFQTLPGDARGAERVCVQLGAAWLDRQLGAIELTVLDVSASGFLLETDEPLTEKTSFIAELPGGVSKFCRIVWSSGRFRGAKFSEPLSELELQDIIVGTVEHLSGLDERAPQSIGHSSEKQHHAEQEYGEVRDNEKLRFATRARIIFGSAVTLWAMIGGIILSVR